MSKREARLSQSLLGVYAPIDNTDAGIQNRVVSFVPDTTGTVTVRLEAGGTTYAIPVVAGVAYPIKGIYSFDSTGTDSSQLFLYGVGNRI